MEMERRIQEVFVPAIRAMQVRIVNIPMQPPATEMEMHKMMAVVCAIQDGREQPVIRAIRLMPDRPVLRPRRPRAVAMVP